MLLDSKNFMKWKTFFFVCGIFVPFHNIVLWNWYYGDKFTLNSIQNVFFYFYVANVCVLNLFWSTLSFALYTPCNQFLFKEFKAENDK
jgi:hypothetical protein